MDLLIVNANLITLDPQSTKAQALAIRDGMIVAVGKNDDILGHRTSKSRVLDAGGRTVLPGLNEPHGHLHISAETLAGITVTTPPCHEIADVVANIRKAASTMPASEPIVGYGFRYDQLKEGRRPTLRLAEQQYLRSGITSFCEPKLSLSIGFLVQAFSSGCHLAPPCADT